MSTEDKAAKLAEDSATLVEALPDPVADLLSYEASDPDAKAEIERRMRELDMTNSQTIIKFGSGAQQELTALSDQMLDGVRNKDLGAVWNDICTKN